MSKCNRSLAIKEKLSVRGGFLSHITPVILTFNEEANIGRVLEELTWAKEVIVVDSGSEDNTREICSRFTNVRTLIRPFDSHAKQWNFAVAETGVKTDWVLAIDADYVLTEQLVQEMASLEPDPDVTGFETRFQYCIWGRPLSGTLYPPVTTLFRPDSAHYVQDGHTQRVCVDGRVKNLRGFILHDDRKPLSRWLWAQSRYAALEAELLLSKPASELRIQDILRRMVVITPWLVPLYCLTVGRGALDGWAGIYYALQRGLAEAVLSLTLMERRILKGNR